MKDHVTGNPLAAPEYLDLNLDGDTSDEGERNEPGAFVRSTTFNVKAKFDVQGVDPTTVKVWAEGEFGGLNSEASPITLDASGTGIFQINTADGTIKYHEAGVWTWKWKMGDDPTVHQIGTSPHTIGVTAGSPVATPVYKWVMIPSCKSCDGLNPAGDDADKQVADRLFQNFEANAKVENTELQYHIEHREPDDKQSAGFLLNNKKAACGHWANYFNQQAEAQGVGTLKVRGFELLPGAPTNFANEEKWKGLMSYAAGVNNVRPQVNMAQTRMVIAGRYAQSSTEPGATDWADTWEEEDPHWVWGMVNHGVVMLQKGTTSYLYDTSFEIGPVALPDFNIPADNTEASYAPNHVFRTQYIDNIVQPFSFIWGKIMFSIPLYPDGLYECYVRVGDESLSPGLPTTVRFIWADFEEPD